MRGESATDGGRVIRMINGNGRRHGCGPETRGWSNFVDFLASPGVAPLCELLRVVEGTYMEAFDLVGADRAYQHYVENCRRLGTKPMPRDRALAKWIDTL